MLAKRIEQKIFTRYAPKLVNHVMPVPFNEAKGLVAQIYDQMMSDFQLVPPVTVHSPLPKLLAGVWGMVRESLVAGPVSRADREVVAEAVSHINECPFCVDVHSTLLYGASEKGAADAIRHGRADQIQDPKTRPVAEWALATRSPGAEILRSPPFSREEAPEIIGSAVSFHYIDRMVNVFLGDSPMPLPSGLRWLRGLMTRMAGSLIGKRVMRMSVRPGDSLALLPEAELPQEFSWAEPKPAVAGAFARLTAVVEEAGEETLPEAVRDLVREKVAAWNGEDPGMSRKWVDEATGDLDERSTAAGRLALLTALASYQVDKDVVEAFRAHFPSDAQLVAATAWASFTAARKVASWLQPASVDVVVAP